MMILKSKIRILMLKITTGAISKENRPNYEIAKRATSRYCFVMTV